MRSGGYKEWVIYGGGFFVSFSLGMKKSCFPLFLGFLEWLLRYMGAISGFLTILWCC